MISNPELKKEGNVVFTHNDGIETTSLTEIEGQTIHLIFNNATGKSKMFLNGGKQIELTNQIPASGI